MKTLILALVVLFLTLSSCVTYKRCLGKFPPTLDTERKTAVKDSIVFRDTTIFIKIPGERVIDSFPIPCPDVPGYIPKRVYAETSLAKASAWWEYPNIKLELIQKDSTIERRLDNALKDAFHWQSEYEKITVTPQAVKYIPGVYKAAFWLWIGVIITGIGYTMFRIFIKK